VARHQSTTTAPPALPYATADRPAGQHRALRERSKALTRTVIGGAGLMLATVATTAAAKPLALEPERPSPALSLDDSIDAPPPVTTTTTTVTPPPPPPPPPPAPPPPAPPPVHTTPPPPPTDQLGVWINQAIRVLEQDGYSASALNSADIRLIILHESGGNPNAINKWDANAANGTPSEGLMQIISPTFRAYALPGHGNIWNPVDNIIAGVRYIVANYGSVSNAPGILSITEGGSYRGY
jgi:hypothetical protein